MRYYPLLLDLHDKSCMVVGVGRVGIRKIKTLLAADPGRLLALDRFPPDPGLLELTQKHPALVFEQRGPTPGDLDRTDLVFACTSDRGLNATIAHDCKKRGILCNITDDPEAGDVVLPSLIQRGDLLLALSTSGKSPALCKRLRQELDCRFGEEYELLLELLGRIRHALLPLGLCCDDNAECFRSLVDSPLITAIRDRDMGAVHSILLALLPEQLHPSIGALTNDLFPSL
ncbi:precorrin-2 dehydrogenase/sirohydrochlorin ferrochelatase family protein [Desulfoplanes sp.]